MFRALSVDLNQTIQAATLTNSSIKALDKSLSKLRGTDEDLGASLNRTLGLYSKLIAVSSSFNKMAKDQAASVAAVKAAMNGLVDTIIELDDATSLLTGVDKEQYDAQSRQLGLYRQLIGLSEQAASIKLKEAQATGALAKAQSDLIVAQAKADASTAKTANLATQSAAASAAKVVAVKQSAAATQTSAVAEEQLGGHLASTRYALYQVAVAYGIASLAGIGLAKSAVSVGAAYEQSFAQVVRTHW